MHLLPAQEKSKDRISPYPGVLQTLCLALEVPLIKSSLHLYNATCWGYGKVAEFHEKLPEGTKYNRRESSHFAFGYACKHFLNLKRGRIRKHSAKCKASL